jgi:hypothetical protein
MTLLPQDCQRLLADASSSLGFRSRNTQRGIRPRSSFPLLTCNSPSKPRSRAMPEDPTNRAAAAPIGRRRETVAKVAAERDKPTHTGGSSGRCHGQNFYRRERTLRNGDVDHGEWAPLLNVPAHRGQHFGESFCCSSGGNFEISVAKAWMRGVASAMTAARSVVMAAAGLERALRRWSAYQAEFSRPSFRGLDGMLGHKRPFAFGRPRLPPCGRHRSSRPGRRSPRV